MAVITTPNTPRGWSPDLVGFAATDDIPDALILTASTVVGAIEGDEPAVRVPYVADDGVVGFVAEGAPIPEADQELDEVVIQTGKVAALGRYSYETLAQPEAARLVTESLSRSVVRKANEAFLANPAVGLGSTGLLNTPGIVEVVTPVENDLDSIVDAISFAELDYGTATHILASPLAWAAISKLKRGADSNESLLGAGTVVAPRSLLNLPVLVTPSVPGRSLVVLDSSAIVSAVSQVRVARSDDAYFSSDSIGVRVTFRLGWAVMHPARVAKLTLA